MNKPIIKNSEQESSLFNRLEPLKKEEEKPSSCLRIGQNQYKKTINKTLDVKELGRDHTKEVVKRYLEGESTPAFKKSFQLIQGLNKSKLFIVFLSLVQDKEYFSYDINNPNGFHFDMGVFFDRWTTGAINPSNTKNSQKEIKSRLRKKFLKEVMELSGQSYYFTKENGNLVSFSPFNWIEIDKRNKTLYIEVHDTINPVTNQKEIRGKYFKIDWLQYLTATAPMKKTDLWVSTLLYKMIEHPTGINSTIPMSYIFSIVPERLQKRKKELAQRLEKILNGFKESEFLTSFEVQKSQIIFIKKEVFKK